MMFVTVTKIVNNTVFWCNLRDIFSKKEHVFVYRRGLGSIYEWFGCVIIE